jgi:hypothetical protein
MDWNATLDAARARGAERRTAPLGTDERPDLRLAAVASASWAAGLALLMLGRTEDGAAELGRAAAEYEESWGAAPAESWGRPIAALRCRLMAGDRNGAARVAKRLLGDDPASSSSPFAGYAAALALLSLDRDDEAGDVAAGLASHPGFPSDVAAALLSLARRDPAGYGTALRSVLRSFETREDFLEDVRVADTVLVLEALAEARGMAERPASPLLPPALRVRDTDTGDM